ncbi:MAG TPA: hypothetical protein EYN91_04275 [Candidatus Melainabacteria bacterium]|jgi:hypothetical protein|nr:hypothetical protein [Candidatus Melainabacteria bacterium]HIN66159.1 hypothetical protein [Candidatus Obscuribacterales bacterium]
MSGLLLFAGGYMCAIVLKEANEILPHGTRHTEAIYSEADGTTFVRLTWTYKGARLSRRITSEELQIGKFPEILQSMKTEMRATVDPYDTDPNLK